MSRSLQRAWILLFAALTIISGISGRVSAQTVIPVAQARAAADGTSVMVQGVVNAAVGVFDSKKQRFYLQDNTGGIAIYYGAGGLPVLVEGDTLTVSGKLNTYKGERELDPAALSNVVKTGHADPPMPLTIKTGELGAKQQGMLITLSGKVTDTHNGFSLNDGSGVAHVFIYQSTGITATVTLGQTVTVTGIGSVYNTSYEINPRKPADVVIGANGSGAANANSTATPSVRERGPEPAKRPIDADPHADQVEIAAVYALTDEATTNEQGEAVRLFNSGDSAVDLTGWTLNDNTHAVKLDGLSLAAHQEVWLAKNAARFTAEFGAVPAAEYGSCEKIVPCLTGTPLALDNQGDDVALLSPNGVIDTFAYGDGYTDEAPWHGTAAQLSRFADYVPAAGQIFYRKLDFTTCLPIAKNTHQATDWAQDPTDPNGGRHLLFPGWNVDQFCDTAKGTDNATTTFLVAPDNSFAGLATALDKARSEIDLELYFLTDPAIVDHLTAAQGRNVKVRVLFDGDLSGDQVLALPGGSVNGYLQTYWAAQEITAHGGEVNFWSANTTLQPPIPHRYNNDHQKFVIIDGQTAVISSENFAQSAFPHTGGPTSTAGNRGAIVITDAPIVVKRLQAIFADDDDPKRSDVHPWQGISAHFNRPADVPVSGYTPIQPQPLTITGPTAFEIVQSPENALNTQDALIGLVAKAGKGDRVLVEQQYEYLTWGSGSATYMNPRLQAYISAARRGATVRLILDGVHSANTNNPTIAAIKKLAAAEHLDLDARLTPKNGVSGNAFHIKMVLVTSGKDGYVHIGSINGSENSSRYNREVAVQVESRTAFDYYAKVFDVDWQVSQPHA
ncbi:MAG: phospholipase D-like domain-containing protein [Aggregatilineales bacterium]